MLGDAWPVNNCLGTLEFKITAGGDQETSANEACEAGASRDAMPSGTHVEVTDDQSHSINFGADNESREACQWTITCGSGSPGHF